jgi:SPP1 family predicted phage head-tail adaptor
MKCCEMSAGLLREPVTFQRRSLTSDGAGGQSETWAAISGAPTRAHVKPLSGRERFASDRIEATLRIRLLVRYSTAIIEGDRVLIRGQAHQIRFINNLEFQDRWLQIDCEGGVAT